MVDASKLYRKARAQNFLYSDHAKQIEVLVRSREEVEGCTRTLRLDEISELDWTLNISRYIFSPGETAVAPLSGALPELEHALADLRDAEDTLTREMSDGGWLR